MARFYTFALVLGCAWLSLGTSAPAPALSARLECQRRAAPGRVLCEAELEVERGVLAWSDVLVIEAPHFAPPLRARVGAGAVFMQSEQRQRLQLALAAANVGEGTLRVRARAVVCPDADEQGRQPCRAITREAAASVHVGPITE